VFTLGLLPVTTRIIARSTIGNTWGSNSYATTKK